MEKSRKINTTDSSVKAQEDSPKSLWEMTPEEMLKEMNESMLNPYERPRPNLALLLRKELEKSKK